MKLVFKTPAKINLGLFVLGKRPDGYHELETLFQMVSLYDTVELEPLDGRVELKCDHPDIPGDDTNLVVRAARLLKEQVPDRPHLGCRIRLEKHIPAGAGLGGGSGNAAGVLWGLNRLWDLQLERAALRDLAARLGSDIPFFLSAPAALGRGRGERLTPLEPVKKIQVILICPNVSIATKEVYNGLKMELTTPPKTINILQKFFSQSDLAQLGAHLHNDLESFVLERYPVVQRARQALRSQGAEGVLLSGSGSAVFGIFPDSKSAQTAYTLVKSGDWEVFWTETISSFAEFLPDSLLHYPKP